MEILGKLHSEGKTKNPLGWGQDLSRIQRSDSRRMVFRTATRVIKPGQGIAGEGVRGLVAATGSFAGMVHVADRAGCGFGIPSQTRERR